MLSNKLSMISKGSTPSPVWVTTSLPNFTITDSCSVSVTATTGSGSSITSISLKTGSLPAGTTLSYTSGNSATIVGTPTSISSGSFTLSASNNKSKSTDQSFSYNVVNGATPSWISTSLSSPITILNSCSVNVGTVSTGTDGPITGVSLMSGTSLANTGLTFTQITGGTGTVNGFQLSGTPTVSGNQSITVASFNKFGASTNQAVTIPISTGTKPTWVSTSIGGNYTIQDTYTINLTINTVSDGPMTGVSLASGTLPTGLSLSWSSVNSTTFYATLSGQISSSNTAGTASFSINSTCRYGTTAQSFSMTLVNGAAPSWSTGSLSSDIVYTAYSQTITLSCGADGGATTVAVKSGSTLPSWATLSGVGGTQSAPTVTITGTPNNLSYVGTTSFYLTATNNFGTSTSPNYSLTVNNGSAPTWSNTSIPDITVLNTSTITLTLDLKDSNSPITGVTQTAGTTLSNNNITISYSSSGTTGTVTLTATNPTSAMIGSSYSVTLSVTNRFTTGVTATMNYKIVNGTLPSLDVGGWWWGIPDATITDVYNSGSCTCTTPADGPLTSVTLSNGTLPTGLTIGFSSVNSTSFNVSIVGTPTNFSNIGNNLVQVRVTNRYGYADYYRTPNLNQFYLKVLAGPKPTFNFSSSNMPNPYYFRIAYSAQTYSVTNATSISVDTTYSGNSSSPGNGVSLSFTNNSNWSVGSYCTISTSSVVQNSNPGSTTVTLRATNKYYPGNGSRGDGYDGPTINMVFNYAWCSNGWTIYHQNCGGQTFTVPSNAGELRVICVGGGGGGASSGTYVGGGTWTGGSGGKAADQKNWVFTTTPGTQYSLYAGSQGARGTNGSAGGNGEASWFNSTSYQANGGGGGFQGGGGGGGSRDHTGYCGNGGPGGKAGVKGSNGSCGCTDNGGCNYYNGGGPSTNYSLNIGGSYASGVTTSGSGPKFPWLNPGGDYGFDDGGGGGGMAGGGNGGISIFSNGCGYGAESGQNGGGGGYGYGAGGGGGSPQSTGDQSQYGGKGANGCVYIEWGDPR